jgi:homoserine O-acetyltransferase
VDRFDANSYLYITKAMNYFDLANGRGSLAEALARATARFLLISFTCDWLYPSYQSLEILNALRSRNRDVAYCELPSKNGHHAFLLDAESQTRLISGFLASTAARGASAGAARRTGPAAPAVCYHRSIRFLG